MIIYYVALYWTLILVKKMYIEKNLSIHFFNVTLFGCLWPIMFPLQIPVVNKFTPSKKIIILNNSFTAKFNLNFPLTRYYSYINIKIFIANLDLIFFYFWVYATILESPAVLFLKKKCLLEFSQYSPDIYCVSRH